MKIQAVVSMRGG